jgi:mono/diheme cytochrome c family protein
MKRLSSLVVVICLLASCELISYAPPVVTSQMASARKGQHVDLTTLQKGRMLLASRCIECHTLPVVWHYNASDWPEIVDSMSHRANLKPAERDAIIAYILAARAQMN